MADEAPAAFARTLDSDFAFTRLMVDDLDAAAAFYATVCGFVEARRLEVVVTGRAMSEIVYQPTYPGGPMLILAKFHDAPRPATDQVMLGVATQDIDAFLDRVERAGGRVLERDAVSALPNLRHAFFADVEGNWLQVSQFTG